MLNDYKQKENTNRQPKRNSNNLKDSSKNLEKQYETQTDQLKKLEKEVGKNTEAYRKQKYALMRQLCLLQNLKQKLKR